MLEAARAHGVQLVRGRMVGADTRGGRVSAVHIERAGHRETLQATHLVLAAGPMLKSVAGQLGVELPIFAERHHKISLADTLGIVPRGAPMLIWLDGQQLPWTGEERGVLAADETTRWLTEAFPAGVHGRPDGSGAATTLLVLFNYENRATEVVFPLAEDEHYAEITLRGMSTMVPAFPDHKLMACRMANCKASAPTRKQAQIAAAAPGLGLLGSAPPLSPTISARGTSSPRPSGCEMRRSQPATRLTVRWSFSMATSSEKAQAALSRIATVTPMPNGLHCGTRIGGLAALIYPGL